MSAYRVGWVIMTATLVTVGMLASALSSPSTLVVEFTTFAVMGALAVLAVSQTDGPRDHRRIVRRSLVGAVVAGSSFAGLVGLTSIVGSAIFLVAIVVAVASPWVVGTVGRWLRSMSRPSEEQLDAVFRAFASASPGFVPYMPSPQGLPATDEQLCRAWCASYRAMESTYSGRKFIRLIDDRAGYLDEMERRNPAGFAAWLASGATATDNPLPYLSLAHIDSRAIDWDELIEGQGS